MAKKPAVAPVQQPANPEPQTAQDVRQVTISFPLAEPLHYAVRMRAVQERTTVKAVMMGALKAIGFDVPDDELVDRRAGRAGRPKGRE